MTLRPRALVTIGRTALPAFALLVALAGASALVRADDEDPTGTPESGEACNAASLHGTYGFTYQGVNLKPDGTRGPEFGGVGVETFNGEGAITGGRLMAVSGGQPVAFGFTGTYSVNADCTGAKTITFDDGLATHYALVLVDRGRQIETAGMDPGTLVAFTQVRQ
jgi:hypothetical protein